MINEPETKPAYRHAEAFCLMWYRCRSCNHIERFWNSRDGVTPFGTTCPKCNSSEMLHDRWNEDQCVPNHIPTHGQGIWIDIPPSLRVVAARARVAAFDDSDYPVPMNQRQEVIELLERDEFTAESPWLVRWP